MPRPSSGRATPASRSSSSASAAAARKSPVAADEFETPSKTRRSSVAAERGAEKLLYSPSKGSKQKAAAAVRPPQPRGNQLANIRALQDAIPHAQTGHGTNDAPYDLPLRKSPNLSDCLHCPTDYCDCNLFHDLLMEALDEVEMTRVVEVAGKNHLCAKSVLPPFVARMAALLDVSPEDTFYDLGSGNGSVCFQMAFMTGCRAVGIELSEHNAKMSRLLWDRLRPKLEAATGRRMPEVVLLAGDLAQWITEADFATTGNTVIWTANLLMPRSVTHFMSERFRSLPQGARIMCFDDLYPHGRAASRSRDPEAFELFEMTDFVWPPLSVEWMSGGGGRFYRHIRI